LLLVPEHRLQFASGPSVAEWNLLWNLSRRLSPLLVPGITTEEPVAAIRAIQPRAIMTVIRVATVRRPKPRRSFIRLEVEPVSFLLIPEHLWGLFRKELGTIAEQERWLRIGSRFSIVIHQHCVSDIDGRTGVLV